MKNKHAIIGLLFLFGFLAVSRTIKKNSEEKEMKASIRTAFKEATNELFGKSVDSVKACNCLADSFYHFIKKDAEELEKFNTAGLRQMSKPNQEQFALFYKHCILTNLTDTNATVNMSAALLQQFKARLKDSIIARRLPIDEKSIDPVCDCVIKNMNNHITIREYLAESYSENDAFYQMIIRCTGLKK